MHAVVGGAPSNKQLTPPGVKFVEIRKRASWEPKQLLLRLMLKGDYIPVYTDGSRDGNAVACATVFPSNTVISMRLPDSASVFTAEVWAIIKALEQINISTASKYIVFTDSLSCFQALHHMKLEHPLIGMVIRKCVFLNIAKKDIVFCWVPSHTGIKGNEKADSAAKSALDLPRA